MNSYKLLDNQITKEMSQMNPVEKDLNFLDKIIDFDEDNMKILMTSK